MNLVYYFQCRSELSCLIHSYTRPLTFPPFISPHPPLINFYPLVTSTIRFNTNASLTIINIIPIYGLVIYFPNIWTKAAEKIYSKIQMELELYRSLLNCII